MTFEIHQPWLLDAGGDLCSFESLKAMRDASVDVVITDPPYNETVHKNIISGTAMKSYVDGGGGPGGVPRIDLPFPPLESYEFAADLVRVARRWALSFCAVEDFGEYRRAVGHKQWIRGGIWYKPNSSGQMSGDRPKAAYEGIAIMHRPTCKVWNGRGSFGVWNTEEIDDDEFYYVCNGTRGEPERHVNQKPLKLCLELVAKFSGRGETVLDLFAGSARIGEACHALGRHYIGLERDPEWVERGRARLAAVAARIPFGAISDDRCLRLCASPKSSDLATADEVARRSRSRASAPSPKAG